MPIYEYICQACQAPFEALVREAEQPVCPQCGSSRLEKQWSVPAAPSSLSQLPVCQPPMKGGGCRLPACGGGGCQFD